MMNQPNLAPGFEKELSPGLDFAYCPRCGKRLVKQQIDGILRNCCTKCGYVQYINPLPGVAVLVERDKSLLIGKRSQNSTQNGKWCLPCGYIEHNENYLDAAQREVLEETGLVVEITSLVSVSSNRIHPDLHTFVAVLTAEAVGGKIEAGDDLVALDWLHRNAVFPEMAFKADQYIIEKYFENSLVRIPVDAYLKNTPW